VQDPEYPEQPLDEVQVREIGNRTYIVADVDPLDVDGTRTVAVGSILWLVAFVLLLPFYGRLADDDKTWWLWTCLAGFGLGVLGWEYCRRRRNHREARAGDGSDAG
jgi:peptidoglycan/LPS O-acetylase OafA/YrhL